MSKDEKKKLSVQMPIVHPDAAGIDVGDTMHVVAVPWDRDPIRVREFGSYTCDLMEIVAWLKQCRIRTVAMESTGVYWKNLFSVLIQNDFEVYLVNARHTKNVTGRKTDEGDAQWIQKLHSCGLLASGFLPDDTTEALRTVVRHRKKLSDNSSSFILRMQKCLELMNIKIHTLLRDTTGKTGIAIIEAILNGERTPENFLPLVHYSVKASKQDIIKSMQGNWRDEHLFLLKQNYNSYQYLQNQIREVDQYIEKLMKNYLPPGELVPEHVRKTPTGRVSKQKKNKNQPSFNVREYLQQILQVDVTEIYGISETTALQIFAECGRDYSKWQTAEHFVSWLNLSPNIKITGGKIVSRKMMKKKPNLATQAFRMSANGLKNTKSWLGDYFRRMKSKGGHKYAIVATARKLAMIYYQMVTKKEPFIPFDRTEYNKRSTEIKIAKLEKVLERLKIEAA
jgi:transposase